jgi:hypothetical protein
MPAAWLACRGAPSRSPSAAASSRLAPPPTWPPLFPPSPTPSPPSPPSQVSGERSLTRSEYCAAVGDLQREIRTLRAYAVAAAVDSASAPPSAAPSPAPGAAPADAKAPSDSGAAAAAAGGGGGGELRAPGAETRESAELSAYYLRVLLDVIRVAHDVDDEDVPLEYLCPLSTLIMHVSAAAGGGVRGRDGGHVG